MLKHSRTDSVYVKFIGYKIYRRHVCKYLFIGNITVVMLTIIFLIPAVDSLWLRAAQNLKNVT
jgi:hypothetical protein